MARTPRTRRLAILTASAALAAGGALIPTAAFAAPAQTSAVATQAPQQEAKTVSGYANDIDVTTSSSDSQSQSYTVTPNYYSYSDSQSSSYSESVSYS
ncbi:hypothetical protein ACFY0A_34975 [Streptomyces sp. NPDC001698]|uniref:hypothetical protein n=1 Tax=unclassified Streptomyces TaxID=2593676 RepID=UPI0036A6893F